MALATRFLIASRYAIWFVWVLSLSNMCSLNLWAQSRIEERLNREVWIATISQEGIQSRNQSRNVEQMLKRMQQALPSKPDFLCLPELFAQSYITDSESSVREAAEQSPKMVVEPISSFAKENGCYVICPTYVLDKDRVYNSALVIDRKGESIGRYDKVHTTLDEMQLGVSPGELHQKVIETDKGKIGVQICYDVEWHDGWDHLRSQAAEIIFWPSAFSGGQMLRSRAWESRSIVVSSSAKDSSCIFDCTGEWIGGTNRWKEIAVASVNLERVFLHTWPSVRKFPEIESKYGRKVAIRTFADEEWSILESRSADVKVQDILKEFELESRDAQIQRSEQRQRELR